MTSRQASELREEIIHAGKPVLAIDTCALLDVLRLPYRETLDGNILYGCKKLFSLATDGTGGVSIVMASTVAEELQQNISEVRLETERKIRQFERTVGRINDLSQALQIDGLGSVSTFNSARLIDLLGQEIGRIQNASKILLEDNGHKVKAADRVKFGRAPSQKGAQQYKDCLIVEAYLDLAAQLRARSFTQKMVFVSSNTNDFGGEGQKLKPELIADFGNVNLLFATNLASAAHKLGLLG